MRFATTEGGLMRFTTTGKEVPPRANATTKPSPTPASELSREDRERIERASADEVSTEEFLALIERADIRDRVADARVLVGECLNENPDPPRPSSWPWSPRRQICDSEGTSSVELILYGLTAFPGALDRRRRLARLTGIGGAQAVWPT